MSGEKYPAELVEKVASAIESTMFAEHELPVTGEIHERYLGTAIAALDAGAYAAMQEALRYARKICASEGYTDFVVQIDAALRAANGEET